MALCVDRWDNCAIANKEAMAMVQENGRDGLEGRYTQVDPETPEPRGVHGQYTEHDGVGPEPDIAGTYIGAERDGQEPLVRSTHQRSGNYPKAEHEPTEHGHTHTHEHGHKHGHTEHEK
jgi:hypothetical protein